MTGLRDLQSPPADPPSAALWWAAHGDWDRAHEAAQSDEGRDAAWVHAYLHRVEGDLPNARYWYSRAGRPEARGPLDAEWDAIAAALAPAPAPALAPAPAPAPAPALAPALAAPKASQ